MQYISLDCRTPRAPRELGVRALKAAYFGSEPPMVEGKKHTQRKRWHYWRNLLLFGLGSCLVAALFIQFVAYPYFMAYRHTHPKRLMVCCQMPDDLGMNYEDVSFETSDGLTLQGWYIPSSNKASIILLHGIGSNRMMMLEMARILAEEGYGVLLFDLRAHGESEGEIVPFGGPEGEDVRGAVEYLQKREDVEPKQIGLLGWSLGAQVGILGAADGVEVQAIVADGPGATTFEDWPMPQTVEEWWYLPFDFMYYKFLPYQSGVKEPVSLRDAIKQIAPRSLLLISGGGIEQHRVSSLFEVAGTPKELWVIPEVRHLGGLSARPEEYKEKVVRFFDETLLK
jgi:pimeloyl-ACP methyl ester carboxylesterase